MNILEIFPIRLQSILDRNFLFHWLSSNEMAKKINAICTGASMPRANMKEFLEFKISFPSLSQQQHIATKLDALSSETKKLQTLCQQKLTALEAIRCTHFST